MVGSYELYLILFLQYYLEKNLDARVRELEREAELEEKAPKVKAKSKMSKVQNLPCTFLFSRKKWR